MTIPDGYTYNGTLTVTATLAVEPDPDTTIASISEVTGLELPYGATISDAILPAEVTVESGSGDEKKAEVTWSLNGAWASPGVNTFTGTIIMPDGYTYNGAATATISTTVTVMEDSAAPKTKKVVGYVDPGAATIAYAGSKELVLAAAKAHLPTEVMLKCEDGSYITVTVSADDWKFTFNEYHPNDVTDQTVSLTQDAVLPAGYSGQTTVHCGVKVLALDTTKLDAALTAAKTLEAKLVDSEAEAMTGDKIYVAGNSNLSVKPEDVTAGVKFVNEANRYAANLILEISYAGHAQATGFVSQQACDQKTAELQAVIDAFNEAIQVGTNTNTEAYVKPLVEDVLSANRNPDAPYNSIKQPLKNGSFYPLFHFSAINLPETDMRLSSVTWSVKGDGASYVRIGVSDTNSEAYGATITSAPETPKSVTFVATAVCINRNDNSKTYTFTLEYPATIGAPMKLSATQPEAPQFASGDNAEGTIKIKLDGAAAITSVDVSKVKIQDVGNSGSSSSDMQLLSNLNIKTAEKVDGGLSFDVSFSSAKLATAVPLENDSAQPPHKPGKVAITIPKETLTLDESSGWYFPEKGLTQTVEVWLCYPQMEVNTQMTGGDKTHRNIDVRTKYIGNESVWVAYTKENTRPGDSIDLTGDANVLVWVQIPFSEATYSPIDGTVTYSVKNVTGFDKPGTYDIWCRAWDYASGAWMKTDSSIIIYGEDTP